MGMTQEEKIAVADMVRSHDRFGPVSPEELVALPGKHGFTTNRIHGWSRVLERQYQFFQEHLR